MKSIDVLLLLSFLFFSIAAVCYFRPSLRQSPSVSVSDSPTISDSPTDSDFSASHNPECRQEPSPATNLVPINRVVQPSLDFEAHADGLRKTYGNEFSVVVEKPFVVIGDQPQAEVEKWATGTIRWAVKQIKESYFEQDPDHIINIWLFKDSESYYRNAERLFGSKPTTPYGYYSPSDKALVMNISTGGGTLVHEIVHPFMAANFEACPSWFNEGLASLYEQSSEQNGKIVGLTNWRLRGLQLAIHDGLLGSFENMMSTTDREFYDGASTNYAQARYLCYWLQQQGKLREFYRRFSENAANDQSGIDTLKEILGTNDLKAFQAGWEKEVLKLRFP
ncbi:DUF1570 domain-containing protein [Mariniblastus fucicola]|uniref:DUF1570 domain-containing protein n=1 Tax=Mariniblastus fucicola TaxID=980251 RepID=A0A5B9P8S1_9BACT|nr:DUF1570 domain-containing protein [Mariniblastus fucicola]QEG21839.1 hypothetical protein MFFC18_16990 [Mariniblastus fucicola]